MGGCSRNSSAVTLRPRRPFASKTKARIAIDGARSSARRVARHHAGAGRVRDQNFQFTPARTMLVLNLTLSTKINVVDGRLT
jgi:hypothetical protein